MIAEPGLRGMDGFLDKLNMKNRALGISFMLLLGGCSKLPVDVGTGMGRGIVRRLDFEHHEVTLSHGTVPNLLHPMTYAYIVKNDSIMQDVKEGDTVSFTIEESQPGTFRVLSMKQIHPPPRIPVF